MKVRTTRWPRRIETRRVRIGVCVGRSGGPPNLSLVTQTSTSASRQRARGSQSSKSSRTGVSQPTSGSPRSAASSCAQTTQCGPTTTGGLPSGSASVTEATSVRTSRTTSGHP
ncbi:MAG TPA: hypothetical protein VKU41_05940 [Polyangiaceae bacterium]|nr:hypothetical protein [Polyangiaceae bacterium]